MMIIGSSHQEITMSRLPFACCVLPLQALIYYVTIQYTNNPHVFNGLGMGIIKDHVLHLAMVVIMRGLELGLFCLRLKDLGWRFYGAYLTFVLPILFLFAFQFGVSGSLGTIFV